MTCVKTGGLPNRKLQADASGLELGLLAPDQHLCHHALQPNLGEKILEKKSCTFSGLDLADTKNVDDARGCVIDS